MQFNFCEFSFSIKGKNRNLKNVFVFLFLEFKTKRIISTWYGQLRYLFSKTLLRFSTYFYLFKDDQTGRQSTISDVSERFDLQLNSTNIESDLNESSSSKSNQGDTTETTNFDSSQLTTNVRSVTATPAVLSNTSRTSMSSHAGQSTMRGKSGRLTSIMEQRRCPDILLRKWLKNQKIKMSDPDETLPLSVKMWKLNLYYWKEYFILGNTNTFIACRR